MKNHQAKSKYQYQKGINHLGHLGHQVKVKVLDQIDKEKGEKEDYDDAYINHKFNILLAFSNSFLIGSNKRGSIFIISTLKSL